MKQTPAPAEVPTMFSGKTFEVLITLSVDTFDQQNQVVIKNVPGADIERLRSKIFTQGFYHNIKPGTIQLVNPFTISTVLIIETKPGND